MLRRCSILRIFPTGRPNPCIFEYWLQATVTPYCRRGKQSRHGRMKRSERLCERRQCGCVGVDAAYWHYRTARSGAFVCVAKAEYRDDRAAGFFAVLRSEVSGDFAFAALGFLLFVRWTRKRFQSMSWSLGPPTFGKEQIPVLLKKRKSASEFLGIVPSDAGRAWRKPSGYVIFQDEGALCEAPAPGCTGDGVPSRGKAGRFPAIRSGPTREGRCAEWKRQGNSGVSVKKLCFQQTFSRHDIARASAALFIWLNENVCFQQTFSRHVIARASAALLIWLNENVLGKGSFSVKTGAFMKYAAIPYRFNLAAIA